MTAIIGREIVVPAVLRAPESATEHIRNALALLHVVEELSPAVWSFAPELGRAARRAEAALVFLEHHGPRQFAAQHLRRAVASLLEAPCDPVVIPECLAAVRRLLQALYLVQA
jgi:hypothetical protein